MGKYKLPSTHELFLNAIPFDLMVEYYEDLYEEDPHAQLDAMRGDDGEIVISDSGDSLIDKWERELSMGLEPDLEEGLSDEEKQKLKRERSRASGVREVAVEALINEDFTQRTENKDLEKHESKFVPVGSVADNALLRASALGKFNRRQQLPTMLGEELKRRGR